MLIKNKIKKYKRIDIKLANNAWEIKKNLELFNQLWIRKIKLYLL